MRKILSVLAVLILAGGLAMAGEPGTDLVGSLSWVDSTESTARTINVKADLTFPIGFLRVGPVFQETYVRFAEPEDSPAEPEYEPPSDLTESDDAPLPAPTSGVDEGGNSVTVWSVGGRATVHFTDSHDGLYIGAEALLPGADSDGYLASILGGYRKAFGDGQGMDGLFRAEYRRQYHRSAGEFVDLGSQQIDLGLGITF